MGISRRHLMITGASFAMAAGRASLIDEASAQATLLERKSLADLPLNDPIMEALREGVRRLKALPASSPLTWANLSAIHGRSDAPGRCPHRNWYFLPWHRAYILMYERIIRNLTGYPQFAMPYWDWTANRRLPEAFARATHGGRANPLYEPSRTIRPTFELPDENVGPAVMSEILATAAFEQFGSSRPRGQNSTDPSWVTRGTGLQGEFEGNPHNRVHGLVGGVLASFGSPIDPVFLMHHCNIDRIWVAWRARGHQDTTDPLWLDMHFENNFYHPDGSRYSPRVREVLDPTELGYSYGAIAPAAEVSPSVSALAGLISQLFAGSREGPGLRIFQTAAAHSATAPEPVQAPVAVDRALLGEVVRRPPLPTAAPIAGVDLRQELAARGTRALVMLHNIDVGGADDLFYRVFVDCDYLSAQTPITDSHYVGTFGFFGHLGGHGEHGGHGGGPSVAMDLTDALQRVHGTKPSVPGSIRVQVLPLTPSGTAPVAASGASRIGAPPPQLRIERVEVAFVTT